jgi:hypothetical protein
VIAVSDIKDHQTAGPWALHDAEDDSDEWRSYPQDMSSDNLFAEEHRIDEPELVDESADYEQPIDEWLGSGEVGNDEDLGDYEVEEIASDGFVDEYQWSEYDEEPGEHVEESWDEVYSHDTEDTHDLEYQGPPTGPASALRAAIAHVAEGEYRRWHPRGRRALVETDPAATPILLDYYRTGVGNRRVSAAQVQSPQFQAVHPWSAVFVSWVMRRAGAGTTFHYSSLHQNYVVAARKNRIRGDHNNPFWAFKVDEIAPQVGDLVCRSRSNSGATFDNVGDGPTRHTHCDIVTAVRPGQIRVIGGNVRQNVDAKVLRTRPDGRLRTDGKQAVYFAVIRCQDTGASVLSPPPATPLSPSSSRPPTPIPNLVPPPVAGGRRITAGQRVVDVLPLLRGHAGSHPDLVLKWNDMVNPSVVDVVVHLHGWALGQGRALNVVRDKLPLSGLDFHDPTHATRVGRTSPTLLILPRGNYDPLPGKTQRYTHPALVKPGALNRLIDESLALLAERAGTQMRRGKLILTAHSGGGAPLMQILEHTDPDEVHAFDALYTDPTSLIRWAARHISSGTGALRVVSRPVGGTTAFTKMVGSTLAKAGSARFRAEFTRTEHNAIPPSFGWLLLADSAAALPGVNVAHETEFDESAYETADFDEHSDLFCEGSDESADESWETGPSDEIWYGELGEADSEHADWEEFEPEALDELLEGGPDGAETAPGWGEVADAVTSSPTAVGPVPVPAECVTIGLLPAPDVACPMSTAPSRPLRLPTPGIGRFESNPVIAAFAADLAQCYAERKGGDQMRRARIVTETADKLATDYAASLSAGIVRYGATWKKQAEHAIAKRAKDLRRHRRGALTAEDLAALEQARCEQEMVLATKMNSLRRGWMVGRREDVDFRTLMAASPRLPAFDPPPLSPGGAPNLVAIDPEGNGTPVTPETKGFLRELRIRATSFDAENYTGHGGGTFRGRGYSVDLKLHGHLDVRGFYPREAAAAFLLTVHAAAAAVGLRWRVLYNDYAVAAYVNRVTGARHVVFMGEPGRNLNWHGPLVLHFHLDLAP